MVAETLALCAMFLSCSSGIPERGPMETEKVCVNLPAAELGKIDVLVAEGLFASRTDVIRSGIRQVLEAHDETVQRVVHTARMGYQLLTKAELETARNAGRKLSVFVVGAPQLARELCSYQPQAAAPVAGLSARQAIELVGRIRGGSKTAVRRRADELIDALDLAEVATKRVPMSGGMARLTGFCMAAV